VLIGPTPEFPIKPDFFSSNRLLLWGNENAPRLVNRELMKSQPFIDDDYWKTNINEGSKNIEYVSLIKPFCSKTECTRWKNGWLFFDSDHLSTLGAESVSGTIRQHLRKKMPV